MVTNLLIKPERHGPMLNVGSFETSATTGIEGNTPCLPLRQVLLLPRTTLDRFSLAPGDLRENIVIDDSADIHDLPSGSVLAIGRSRVRLTFHCEPCRVISDKVNLKAIQHHRGVLGLFLDSGRISVGDPVELLAERYEAIPYGVRERILWFLERRPAPVSLVELLFEVGLSKSYARGIATMVRRMPPAYRDKVLFRSDMETSQGTQEVLSL